MAYTRLDILKMLSGKETPNCECCQEERYWTLTIDHIKGGGTKHRREIANTSTWVLVAREMRKGKTEAQCRDDYRVYCQNCNYGSRVNKNICPHETEKEINESKNRKRSNRLWQNICSCINNSVHSKRKNAIHSYIK